jgi:hypothetical protein
LCAIWSNPNPNTDREPNPDAYADAMHREMCTHAEASPCSAPSPVALVDETESHC